MKINFVSLPILLSILCIAGCSTPEPGADKTVISSTMGAGIGAGAGAIIGNQVGNLGQGAGIGAGVGLISGFTNGIMFDSVEKKMLAQNKELGILKVQNNANSEQLARLQFKLDKALTTDVFGGMYQVFFDVDVTDLKAGSAANLETISNSIKASPYAYTINVVGHTDDSGNVEYNDRLAESRARNISATLIAKGISADQISVTSYGALRPIASNNTEAGRQLNRRVDIFISH
ncbi:MAG: OmpA family protein [bacterium]|nr:OmpA family protein [bacterium]